MLTEFSAEIFDNNLWWELFKPLNEQQTNAI